jgi:hypothetical protein
MARLLNRGFARILQIDASNFHTLLVIACTEVTRFTTKARCGALAGVTTRASTFPSVSTAT